MAGRIVGADIVGFAHGTTVATNALLKRRGATIRMITTRGFRDLVEIGRQARPMICDLQVDAPPAARRPTAGPSMTTPEENTHEAL
ncbi:MAG: hypothetical protein IT545_00040 [Rhodobacteraceae bacterium]|nr:hypothetical protein [Paracoccaceae bacterium]